MAGRITVLARLLVPRVKKPSQSPFFELKVCQFEPHLAIHHSSTENRLRMTSGQR